VPNTTQPIEDPEQKNINVILGNNKVKEFIGADYTFKGKKRDYMYFKRTDREAKNGNNSTCTGATCKLCGTVHDNDKDSLYFKLFIKRDICYIYARCFQDEQKRRLFVAHVKLEIECKNAVELYLANIEKHLARMSNISHVPLKNIDLVDYAEPNMRPYKFSGSRFMFIQAPMKAGKSKELRRAVNEIRPGKIICISCRRTLAHETKANFKRDIGKDFVMYSDIEGEIDMDKEEYKWIIIQVESLHRLTNYTGAMIILDESESIMNQLSSSTNKQTINNFSILKKIVYHSDRSVFMDAYIGERTYSFAERILGLHNNPEDTTKSILMHKNNIQNLSDYTARVTAEVERFTTMLMADIAAGYRVAVVTNKKSYATGLHDELKTKLGPTASILYAGSDWHTSEHDETKTRETVKQEHMYDINNALTSNDIKVMIMTPTISAGVSIELPGYFNKVYGYYTPHSCDVLTGVQMLGRVRDVAARQYTLCFDPECSYFPTDINEIFDCIDDRRKLLFDYDIDKFNMRENADFSYVTDRADHYNIMRALNIKEHNKSVNSYGLYFCELLRYYGCNIEIIKYDREKDTADKEAKREERASAEAIKQASKAINKEDYEKYFNVELDENTMGEVLKEGFEPNPSKPIEYWQVKKAKFMKKFDLSFVDMAKLDGDIMRKYDRNSMYVKIYNNLTAYYTNTRLGYNYKDIDSLPYTYGAVKTELDKVATPDIMNDTTKADFKHQPLISNASKVKYTIILLNILGYSDIDDIKQLTEAALSNNIDSLMKRLRDDKALLKMWRSVRPGHKDTELKDPRFSVNLRKLNGIFESILGVRIKKSDRHSNSDDYHIEHAYFTKLDDEQWFKIRFHELIEKPTQDADNEQVAQVEAPIAQQQTLENNAPN